MKTKIGIILLPLFCLLLSFFVLISDPGFTDINLKKNSVVESREPTKVLLSYFAGFKDIPSVFSGAEKSHLEDVKQIIIGAFITLIILVLVEIKCINKNNWKKIVKNGFFMLLVILLLAIIIPFDFLFTKFHQVFFPQGNWVFPESSTLIQFYPKEFFVYYAISIAIHALIVGLILYFFIIISKK